MEKPLRTDLWLHGVDFLNWTSNWLDMGPFIPRGYYISAVKGKEIN